MCKVAIKQIFILIIINLVNANSFGTPLLNNDCQVVQHTAYTACYSEVHEQSYWVSYSLYREQLKVVKFGSTTKPVERDNQYATGEPIRGVFIQLYLILNITCLKAEHTL